MPFAELDPHRRDRDDRGFFGRYTKVNRCLTERGRRLAGIEGGIECAEVAPLLASVTDSGAGAEAAALVAPHMSRCLSCRARLKAQRTAARRPRTEGGELVRASALRGMRLRAYLIVAAPRPAAVRAELEELAEITQCAACAGDPIESTRTRDAGLAPVERRKPFGAKKLAHRAYPGRGEQREAAVAPGDRRDRLRRKAVTPPLKV